MMRSQWAKDRGRREDRIWMAGIVLVVMFLGLVLRDLPFIKYGFLYGVDSLGHFWFSKMIVDIGYIFPKSIDISYAGGTGWFTGYAPWVGFHIIEAITSIVTGIPLEKLFLNLVALLSIITILPIYLAFRKKLESPYQKIGLLILGSFWFYFIFYSFIGAYETLGVLLFILIIYLIESGIEQKKSGKFLFLVFLTILTLTHHLSVMATLFYLILSYLIKEQKSPLVYITYIVLLTLIIGHIFDTINIGYHGLYEFGYKLLIIPVFAFVLRFIWKRINLETLIKTFLSKIASKRIGWLGILGFFIFAVFIIKFGDLISSVHYAFASPLIVKYMLFLSPLILILIYQVLSKTSNFYNEIMYILGITLGFFTAGIYSGLYFLMIRSLEFVSLFVIAIIATFSIDKKKLAVIFLISILSVVPVIPSYFYGDSVDRPYYPIPKDLIPTKELPSNTESQDFVLNSLLKVYGKHGCEYYSKLDHSSLSVFHGENLIYQRDLYFKPYSCISHPDRKFLISSRKNKVYTTGSKEVRK